jgi:hypothetical protein
MSFEPGPDPNSICASRPSPRAGPVQTSKLLVLPLYVWEVLGSYAILAVDRPDIFLAFFRNVRGVGYHRTALFSHILELFISRQIVPGF